MSNKINFYDLDFTDCEADVDETKPLTISFPDFAKFDVSVKKFPLFYTATWKIIATVNEISFAESLEFRKEPSLYEVNLWARNLIRNRKDDLQNLYVEVIPTYLKYGGRLFELGLI